MSDLVRTISRIIDPLKRRVSLMVGRAILSAAADDSLTLQTLQLDVLSDETLSDLERFQNYGFTGVPFKGAEAVVVFAQGNRDHGLVIAVDDRRYRLKGLQNGEVAMYTDEGDKIHIKRGGIIEIDCSQANVNASSSVKLNSPSVELGESAVEAVIKGNTFQDLFNAHTHSVVGITSTPPLAPLDGSELSEVSKTE